MKVSDIKKKIKKGTLPVQSFIFGDEDKHISNVNLTEPSFEFVLDQYKKGNVLFFSGNVPSLKNSKEIGKGWLSECCNSKYDKHEATKTYVCRKCNKTTKLKSVPQLRSSDLVQNYKKEKVGQFMANKPLWLRISSKVDYPYLLAFYFIRATNSRFDFDNAKQIILDMFRASEYIPDDCADYVRTLDIGFHKDSENPGVYIFLVRDIKLNIVESKSILDEYKDVNI